MSTRMFLHKDSSYCKQELPTQGDFNNKRKICFGVKLSFEYSQYIAFSVYKF